MPSETSQRDESSYFLLGSFTCVPLFSLPCSNLYTRRILSCRKISPFRRPTLWPVGNSFFTHECWVICSSKNLSSNNFIVLHWPLHYIVYFREVAHAEVMAVHRIAKPARSAIQYVLPLRRDIHRNRFKEESIVDGRGKADKIAKMSSLCIFHIVSWIVHKNTSRYLLC